MLNAISEKFNLVSKYQPAGDQPNAIKLLTASLKAGNREQTLIGVTGSGKTFTMANIVANLNKPTLVISHNKTLAAQLASEFQEFFPQNAVQYFVSYYDYYQPEAYVPRSDTYIEKETEINEEIDRLRNSATQNLLSRRDVLIVASVSCIYGLGNPANYLELTLDLTKGMKIKRDKLLRRLTDLQYSRNDIDLRRGTYRVRGETIEIVPSASEVVLKIAFFGDEIENISEHDILTGEDIQNLKSIKLFPAKHFVTPKDKLDAAVENIREELRKRLQELKRQDKILEMQRLEQRTNFDLEMMLQSGFVSGIENYSRHLDFRKAGEPPSTLLDYFPDDFLMFIDESHMTIPQIGGMYEGDHSRKQTLVDYGFRLPSAMDNRPLKFTEFENKINQVVYVSATPAPFELKRTTGKIVLPKKNETLAKNQAAKDQAATPKKSKTQSKKIAAAELPRVVEQLVRPTGLLDPTIEIKPIKNQVDDLIEQIQKRTKKHQRVLVTTLTKRMAEELAEYLKELGIAVHYLHSEIDTFERLEILRDLRLGVYDVLVGINLLREGLDLPEVSLVAILDADKEGFLRSETSFMQIMGRAARHASGHVIMYADKMTGSMQRAIAETTRRRKIQEAYNKKHGITPQTIQKIIKETRLSGAKLKELQEDKTDISNMDKNEVKYYIDELEEQMDLAARNLEYEKAAMIRDRIMETRKIQRLKKGK
jgi:excinuclease ABC subunit B